VWSPSKHRIRIAIYLLERNQGYRVLLNLVQGCRSVEDARKEEQKWLHMLTASSSFLADRRAMGTP
jgi:hypothetical protein